jgi:hypothetical protein
MKRIVALAFSLCWALLAGPPVTKIWQRDAEPVGPVAWTAKWIWSAQSQINSTVLARKSFDLAQAPAAAALFISADSHYRLYLNGEFLNRGPARCSARKQSYDVLEVASLLRPGRNTLAILAYHCGVPNSFHDAGRPGLLAQLELGGETIATDSSWRVRRAIEWDTLTPRIEGKQGFVEVLDFRRAVPDWTLTTFDDSQWEHASPVLAERSTWIPQQPYFEPQSITKPWLSLVARDLPYLTESPVKATRLIQMDEVLEFGTTGAADVALNMSQDVHLPLETCRIQGLEEYAAGRAALEVVNSPRDDSVRVNGIRSSYLVFDLGELMYGHPLLEVEGPAGTVIDIGYATQLIGGKVVPAYMGMRLADRVTLSAKPLRWEGRERKAFRYIALTVRNATRPVRFRSIGLIRTAYPFVEKGTFEMPGAPGLNRLWRAGIDTLLAVTTDAYTDNYREQRQYAGTSFYAARANYAVFGDTRLQRRYLMQVAAHQLPNGILPPYAPVPDDREPPVILEYNLFWLMGLRDYLLFSGDTATVKALLPTAAKILERFREMENHAGLIENPPYPFWIDHANIDHRGESFALNALYMTALENYLELLGWLELPDDSDNRGRSRKLRAALRSGFWSESRGLFADGRISGELSPRFSEQTNSLALAFDLATPEQAKSIASAMMSNHPLMVRSTSLFMYWIADGLFRAGFGREALDLLERRFRHMLDAGFGTLWEEWSLTASSATGEWQPSARATAQAEAAFPPYTFMRWLLGVEPIAPGWSEILIHPPPTGQAGASGTIPLPHGLMTLKWASESALTITVPAGPRVALALSGSRWKEVVVDGAAALPTGNTRGRVALSPGFHEVLLR